METFLKINKLVVTTSYHSNSQASLPFDKKYKSENKTGIYSLMEAEMPEITRGAKVKNHILRNASPDSPGVPTASASSPQCSLQSNYVITGVSEPVCIAALLESEFRVGRD